MQITVNLKANTRTPQVGPGSYLLVLDTGAATSLDITVRRGSEVLEQITTAKKGTKMRLPAGVQFDRIDFLSTVDASAQVVISDGLVDVDLIDGANVNVTLVGPHTGTPGDPINVTAVTVADSPATSQTDLPSVAVTSALTAVLAADANRTEVRYMNLGPDACAVGGASLTWAKRVIVLDVGDVWVENRAANLAQKAICDAGKTAALQVQEVKR